MRPDGGNRADHGGTRKTGGPIILVVGLLALAGIAWLVYSRRAGPERPPKPAQPPAPAAEVPGDRLARGLELFAKQCAACHGEMGRGDGLAATLLYPKPRDFSRGVFLLTTTQAGPSDEDLLHTLRFGMPGSAMPPWGHLPDEDLQALVQAVRHLAVEGMAAKLLAEDRSLPREEALQIAQEMIAPGPPVELPPKPAEIDMERGKKYFVANCAPCHDEDGRGRLRRDMLDSSGRPTLARDFTQGIFKGNADERALATRLVGGLPGSPMPATAYKAEDLWATVKYLQTLIKAGAQERIQQRQQTLTAQRVQGSLSLDAASAVWDRSPATFLAVMPLWWRHDRIEGVSVQAVHDGSKLALRLTWDDATPDDHVAGQTAFSDGVAVQLSPSPDPPLFAMGAKDAVVQVWYWQAARQRLLDGGPLALHDRYPNMPHTDEDAYPGVPKDEIFLTGLAAGNPVSAAAPASSAENLEARGFGTLTHHGSAVQDVQATGKRASDAWQVVFVRNLDSGREGEVRFESGQTVHVALAVWDGNVGDRNGQKSVTIWHRLKLEP